MSISAALLALMNGTLTYSMVSLVVGHTTEQTEIPWDKLLGLGSGGLIFGVSLFFFNREQKLRDEHREILKEHLTTTKAVASEFSSTTKANFEQTATLLRESKADAERREDRIKELYEEVIKRKP